MDKEASCVNVKRKNLTKSKKIRFTENRVKVRKIQFKQKKKLHYHTGKEEKGAF